MLSKGNLSSLQISVFGVMLGDSYEAVVERLGIPDLSFTPADNSYTNIDYRAKLGIGGTDPGLTIHVENNTVTQMIIKSPMNKYLRGNTTLGQDKELIYYLFDPPDYNSFLSSFKVFHYVEKGMDFYLKADNVDRIAFYYPREFKGVEYRTVQREVGPGIFNNITEPFEIV